MTKVLLSDGSLSAIAAAIRGKLGVATRYKPGEMAAAIGQIHGQPVNQQKTATQNGDVTPDAGFDGLSRVTVNVPPPTLVAKTIAINGAYPAANDNADGYSSVTVNVPNTYAAADEGKVVQNGALAVQTRRNITSNGTYDTTGNNAVVVSVAGGEGGGGGGVIKIEMLACPQYCYLYAGGAHGWAVYPSSPAANNAETFYADIPASHQNGGLIILSTEIQSGATYQFTRNRLGFTDGNEDVSDLPNGNMDGITTQPDYYMNALSVDGTKQFTLVRVPNGMKRVFWTTTQATYRVAGQKCYMWLIYDEELASVLGINWRYAIPNTTTTANEGKVTAWPL